jgi:pimeloyl-ACP methyl ester carboxylesterase
LVLAVVVTSTLLLIHWTERWSYMLYLFDDIVSHCQYARRQRPDWEQRYDVFADYLIEAAMTSGVDEIVVVGHSSGSFVALDVLMRALARDPDLGRHGPHIVFLTVGSNIPAVGLHPAAGWIRDCLACLAVEPSVDWIEYQSRKDVMSFYRFDPIAGHGIDVGAARRNPQILSVRFRDIMKPESYSTFRWRFLRIHFQFLRANERAAAYDYFMIVCGPFSLPLRAQRPKDVLEAAAGDAAVSEAAWQRLDIEVGDADLPGRGELGGLPAVQRQLEDHRRDRRSAVDGEHPRAA